MKFLLARRMIFEERYWVEAGSEEEALDLGHEGEVDNRPADESEWVDYAEDYWTCVEVKDDLVEFLESKTVDS